MKRAIDESIVLYRGDCLDVMPLLAAEGVKVDMVLADPPYGTTACKWDKVIPFPKMWECLLPLTAADTPVVLFGNEPFSSRLRLSNAVMYRYDWIWVKDTHSNFLNARRQPCKRHELISVFYRKQPLYNYQYWQGAKNHSVGKSVGKVKKRELYSGKYEILDNDYGNRKMPISILHYNRVRNNEHPTQKPVPLLEYLIRTYTNEGGTVLDFAMGSGSTAVACRNTGRKFIGIEIDERYFDMAETRIGKLLNENGK
jgi:site-specific DNA-methyltransferase (adenine-specific)